MDEKELVTAITQAFPFLAGLGYSQIFVLALILAITTFLGVYFSEKAKNTASREDVKKLTRLVEEVKADVQKDWLIDETKFKLKYEALLGSLVVLDCYFSVSIRVHGLPKSTEQYSTIEQVRECHNKLLLTCDSEEVVNAFVNIMFPADYDTTPPTVRLNQYRRLVRKELGFGDGFDFSEDVAFVSTINFQKK